ncbi:MAG: thioredoxin [Spirochaetae bacterium HGW-Spirochaetae-7]|jgi:thiol-disulfide isomerase/thioredoxin|nr:MAG: thioredoxin [Spirochaetae bacterium HGW-Spirochaetae-7]
MLTIDSYQAIQDLVAREKAVLLYFSFPSCAVCKSIQPKVVDLVEKNFPLMGMYYIDIEAVPEASGQLSVFTVPAVLVFFEGKEMVREARNFGIRELGAKMDRYYGMVFDGATGPGEA